MSRLDDLVDAARADVERRKRETPPDALRSRLDGRGQPRPFSDALAAPGLSLIAEFKRRSPSAGDIRTGAEVEDIVGRYERGGASALSVLTDGPAFGGSLDDLRAARAASELPVLRKDFIVDPYQIHESALHGADAVLLIVAALDDDALASLHDEATRLDLDCVVEVHDEGELVRALEMGAEVIGINNRDLRELTVDLDTTRELITDVPAGGTVVAESGYENREQLSELERIGVDAVLVGELLMRAPDPEALVRELLPSDDLGRASRLERAHRSDS